MSDRKIIKFRPEGTPEQLTRDQLKTMSPEDIERARVGGHLEDVLAGKKPAAPAPTRTRGEELADEIIAGNRRS